MTRLTLTLFGGFELRTVDSGHLVTLPTRKAEALLSFLLLGHDDIHRRDSLAALLWSEVSREQGRHSLRQTLVNLRRTFASFSVPDAFPSTPDTVGVLRGLFDVDVLEFERLATLGTPGAVRHAAELYRGELLDGINVREAPFDDWLFTERTRLRQLALTLHGSRLQMLIEAGDTQQAIQTAMKLLAFDPLQEHVHRTLMTLYARSGQLGSALRQFELCSRILARELGIEPSNETRALYKTLLTDRARRRESSLPGTPPATGDHRRPKRSRE